jgi:hypothetical protein
MEWTGKIAEYAIANRLVKELAYKWWASHVLSWG